MSSDSVEDNTFDVYNTLVRDLEKLDDCSSDFDLEVLSDDFPEKLRRILGRLFLEDAKLGSDLQSLAFLNIAKMFFEVIVRSNQKRHLIRLENIFLSFINGNDFAKSFMSFETAEISVLFTIAEAVAFYSFACHKFSCCKECYKFIHEFLVIGDTREHTSMGLLVFERLCELRETFHCEMFDEFLIGGNGIISNADFMEHVWNGGFLEHKIRILRICSKLIDLSLGNLSMLRNIDWMLNGHEVHVHDHVTHFLYLKLLKSLFLHPGESGEDLDVVTTSALKVLDKFSGDKNAWQSKETSKFFGGTERGGCSSVDTIVFINLILKLVLSLGKSLFHSELAITSLKRLQKFVSDEVCEGGKKSAVKNQTPSQSVISMDLVTQFTEQDDELVDFLLFQLQLHCHLDASGIELEDLCVVNPHHLFMDLLESISHDSSVLIDWLVSNETQFLQYLVMYLKFALATWSDLTQVSTEKDETLALEPLCSGGGGSPTSLNLAMKMLSKLRSSICRLEKAKLFPYSAKPLIKLLDAVQQKSGGQ